MGDRQPTPDGAPVLESEQQRVERVRVEERKRHAALTTQALKARYGIDDSEA
jgi:hypothetical protein